LTRWVDNSTRIFIKMKRSRKTKIDYLEKENINASAVHCNTKYAILTFIRQLYLISVAQATIITNCS
jgi:hypothetical protein